jgi:hypothetical protein
MTSPTSFPDKEEWTAPIGEGLLPDGQQIEGEAVRLVGGIEG